VFILPGDAALLQGAWRAVTLVSGLSSPLVDGLTAPQQPAGLVLSGAAASARFGCPGASPAEQPSDACSSGHGGGGSSGGGGGSGISNACSAGLTLGGNASNGTSLGACPLPPAHSEVCVATMTYVQILLGVWAPLIVGYILLLRTKRRLLREHLNREGAGGAVSRTEGSGALSLMYVTPLAVLFLTATVSNLAYWGVTRSSWPV